MSLGRFWRLWGFVTGTIYCLMYSSSVMARKKNSNRFSHMTFQVWDTFAVVNPRLIYPAGFLSVRYDKHIRSLLRSCYIQYL